MKYKHGIRCLVRVCRFVECVYVSDTCGAALVLLEAGHTMASSSTSSLPRFSFILGNISHTCIKNNTVNSFLHVLTGW